MNLILINPSELTSSLTSSNALSVVLTDRRADHIREIHQPLVGDYLRVGVLEGEIFQAKVIAIESARVVLEIDDITATPPPKPLPVVLVMALPRPKMLRRILQSASSMGVKEIWLIHSYRVDKSYWSSPFLDHLALQSQLQLGLEQACDTRMPNIYLRKRFKPFVEDELPGLASGRRAWVAHPYDACEPPSPSDQPTLLAVGPEGGFIPYEVEKLKEAGLEPLSLGQRILRVETAIPVALSRLFPVG